MVKHESKSLLESLAELASTKYWSKINPYIFLLCSILTLVIAVYLGTHAGSQGRNAKEKSSAGIEMIKLNTTDVAFISTSLLSDSVRKDTIVMQKQLDIIEDYLLLQYPEWDSANRTQLKEYFKYLTPASLTASLDKQKIKVRSYFWLSGKWAYAEIVFWAVFGVLASLIFYVSEIAKDPETSFKSKEIPSQIAKLFYAPLVTLILIFSYDYFAGESAVDIEASKGILIVSFLLGFYSGRAMDVLNRVKELLLPYNSTPPPGKQPIPEAEQPTQEAKVLIRLEPSEKLKEEQMEYVRDHLAEAVVTLIAEGEDKEEELHRAEDGTYTARIKKDKQYEIKASMASDGASPYTAELSIDGSKVENDKEFSLELTPPEV